MYKSFKKYFTFFLDEMTESIRIGYTSKSNRYKKLNRKMEKLQKEIIESMPEDKQSLFLKHEECINSMDSLADDYIYRKGLFHGIRIAILCIRIFRR